MSQRKNLSLAPFHDYFYLVSFNFFLLCTSCVSESSSPLFWINVVPSLLGLSWVDWEEEATKRRERARSSRTCTRLQLWKNFLSFTVLSGLHFAPFVSVNSFFLQCSHIPVFHLSFEKAIIRPTLHYKEERRERGKPGPIYPFRFHFILDKESKTSRKEVESIRSLMERW